MNSVSVLFLNVLIPFDELFSNLLNSADNLVFNLNHEKFHCNFNSIFGLEINSVKVYLMMRIMCVISDY